MRYNWTSAATPEGRERLKELAKIGCQFVIVKYYIPHDQRYEVSQWSMGYCIEYAPAEGIEEPIEFLDPEPPTPKPITVEEMREYCIAWCKRLGLVIDEACYPYDKLWVRRLEDCRWEIYYVSEDGHHHLANRLSKHVGETTTVEIYVLIRAIERGEIGGSNG